MSRTPMTPERFQARDVKRRLTQLENRIDYLKADFARLSGKLSRALKELSDRDEYQYGK